MPQGNKKPARNINKKKKGKAGHGIQSEVKQANMATKKRTTQFSQSVLDDANWSDYITEQDTNAPQSFENYQSIYVRYKDATKRVKEGLRSLVPEDIFRGDQVQCLVDAVDYMEANNITNIPVDLIKDLKLSIRVRQSVAKSQYLGGDEGHSYFLSALVYCFVVLRRLNPLTKRANPSVIHETEPNENRFSALSMEEDGEDEETDLPSGPVAKPDLPKQPVLLTLEQLMSGSDREAAILFLMTLDEIMSFNSKQYAGLKRSWARYKRDDLPPSVIIIDLLEASTVANMGLQYVQFLEQKLALDYPHMNTIYRLMSVLVFPELTEQLLKDVTSLSPIGTEFKVTDATTFLGDCLEKSIRNDSDQVMKNIAADFCEKWQIPRKAIDLYYIQGIQSIVNVELPVGNTRELNRPLIERFREQGVVINEGSWLSRFKFIGTADRSILMTTKFLQGLSTIIQARKGHLIGIKGMFGRSWDETETGKAKRIVQDMDELMMGEILPVLINVCYGGLLQNLPNEEGLLPLFSLLRNYVKRPTQPVSWALAFAVHTISTSIFDLQGGNDVHDIAEVAEASFDLYFEQLSIASKVMKDGSQPKFWESNMKRMQVLKLLVAPPTLQPSRQQSLRAFWNPLCAGNFLGYIAYFSNVEEGSWMIDNFSQLRMVLHLYNALKDVGLEPPDNQGFLELLDRNFHHSKAIWEGPKPTKGSFVLRWWIAFGADVKEARRMRDEAAARFSNANAHVSDKKPSHSRLQGTTRRMTPIEPDKLSKSYRRIMNRDFTDVVDKYHTTEKQKADPLYDHAVRCNDTLDAIYEDQQYLAMNMTAVGAHLNSFVDQFFDYYWKAEVQMMVRSMPDAARFGRRTDGRRVGRRSWETSDANLERLAMVHIFAEQILGRLDFLDLSVPDPVIVQPMAFMTLFFDRIPPESIMYFTPTQTAP